MSPTAERNRGAFSMIELLVVLALLALLSGMVMPLIGVARRQAKRSHVACDLARIETAIEAFRCDAGHRPWAAPPETDAGPWPNGLAFRLGHVLSSAERTSLKADLSAVGAAFAAGGSRAITAAQVDQPADSWKLGGATPLGGSGSSGRTAVARCVNRLAAERGRIAVLSGNTGIAATVPGSGAPWIDGAAILPAPASRGWADDYLAGQIPPASIVGDDILDPWGKPYVYIHPVVNGVEGFAPQLLSLGEGSTAADGGLIVAAWFGLATRTRSATTLLDSDMRTHAAPDRVASHELWSAGPDGRISVQRNTVVNRDDIPAAAYLRGLR